MNRDELLRACLGRSDFPPAALVLEVCDRVGVLAHAEGYEREVVVGTETVAVWGIAQVCTDPARRGLGLASSLVRALHAEGRDRGFRFAALFSDYIDFYRPLGYLQTSRVPLLVAPLTELPWPDGHVAPGGEW